MQKKTRNTLGGVPKPLDHLDSLRRAYWCLVRVDTFGKPPSVVRATREAFQRARTEYVLALAESREGTP